MVERHFQTLMTRYEKLIGHGIRRVCGRRYQTLIPDVEQEVHLSLWKSLKGGIEIENPASYLYKIALRTGLRMVKHHQRALLEPATLEEEGKDQLTQKSGATFEQKLFLKEAIGDLPDDQKRALKAYWVGMNHIEIAELYGWTPSQARHRVYRGMDALRASHSREIA